MEELYLETEKGKTKINEEIVDRYGLNKGTVSPFTGYKIMGKNGEYYLNKSTSEALQNDFNDMAIKGFESGGIDQMENGFELSQSEIIDFSQGTDSTD